MQKILSLYVSFYKHKMITFIPIDNLKNETALSSILEKLLKNRKQKLAIITCFKWFSKKACCCLNFCLSKTVWCDFNINNYLILFEHSILLIIQLLKHFYL